MEPSAGTCEALPRSGHSAAVYGDKMFIFGGIVEITKELNEMLVFNFSKNYFQTFEEVI